MIETRDRPQQTPRQPLSLRQREHDAAPLTSELSLQARLKRIARSGLVSLWRVLPRRMRRLAMRLGMPRVSVGACALVQDAHGLLLLARHTYRKRPWGLPGGLIGRDEQPHVALARELQEELGVEAVIGSLVYAETYLPAQHLTLYYTATLHGTPRADGVELDDLRFVTLEEARVLLGRGAEPLLAALCERRAS